MGIFWQKYWSELPVPPTGDLPDSWIEPMSPSSPALAADSLPTEPPGKPLVSQYQVSSKVMPKHLARGLFAFYNFNQLLNNV